MCGSGPLCKNHFSCDRCVEYDLPFLRKQRRLQAGICVEAGHRRWAGLILGEAHHFMTSLISGHSASSGTGFVIYLETGKMLSLKRLPATGETGWAQD